MWTDKLTDRAGAAARDLGVCLGFFSRLPLPVHRSAPGGVLLNEACGSWPLAGLLLGVGPMAILILFPLAGFPPLIGAIAAVGVMMLLTGALHEDGLADTADGLGGGIDAQDKLAIMSDSKIGTFGVLALTLSVLARVVCLGAMESAAPIQAAIAFGSTAIISRSAALWHWEDLAAAKTSGLAVEIGPPTKPSRRLGLLTGVVAFILVFSTLGQAALFGGALAVLGVYGFSRLCAHQIGGHTGDTIGAAQQITETVFLAGLVTFVAGLD